MKLDNLKPMGDKASEAVKLIKQIQGLGIAETDPSYLMVKAHLNEWIKSQDTESKEYTIEFPRYGRKAILTLPWRANQTCTFSMKMNVSS